MPFFKAEGLEKKDLDYIYSDVLKKAVEEFEIDGRRYFQVVERFESRVGSIINGIVNNLNTAELVIADLTGLNPNVMYELGVRHALKRGTIILSQHLDKLPSDLRDYLIVGYSYSTTTTEQPSLYKKFKLDLHKTILEVITTNKDDSPVLSYLQVRQRFRNEEAVDLLKENVIIIDAIETIFNEIQNLVNLIFDTHYGTDNNLFYQLITLKLNALINALNELRIPHNSSILYENLTNAKTLLAEVNKVFVMSEYFYSLGKTRAIAEDVYKASDIKGCIESKFVDVFALTDENKVSLVDMRDFFKAEGILQTELIEYLLDYKENKAKELGVEEEELEALLRQ